MRLIFTILSLGLYIANATNYYVSSGGNDISNNGTSVGQPYKTIAKAISVAVAYDSINLNKGDVWIEKLRITMPHLTFSSYGTGAMPHVTGLQTVTGLTNAGGNIWTATLSASSNLNMVLVNGTIRAKGRYPNTTYLTQSGSTATQLNNTGLTGTPDYTGAEVAVKAAHWIINKSTISSQSGAILNLASSLVYTPISGYGFIIQNIPSVLDVDGEWCYNSTTGLFSVYYAGSTPTVQVSTIDTLVQVVKSDSVIINGIQFTGSNVTTIQLDTSRYVYLKYNSINNSGANGISSTKSTNLNILYDTIQNSLNDGMYIVGGKNGMVYGNVTINSGMMVGMGQSGEAKQVGNYIGGGDFGQNDSLLTYQYNRVLNSGYSGFMCFSYYGNGRYNYIYNSCSVKDDGGGAYIGWVGFKMNSNIIHGNTGAPAGAVGQIVAPGIYYDDNQSDNYADSNTIFDCTWAALFFHNNGHNTARNNLLIANSGYPLYETQLSSSKNYQYNVLYSQNNSYSVFNHYGISSTDTINYNVYTRPTGEGNKLTIAGSSYNFNQWQSVTGYDSYSIETPTGVTTDAPLLVYNNSNKDSTISLGSNSYYNAKGIPFRDKIVLKSFRSELLFKSQTDFLKITGQLRSKLNSPFKSL